MSVFVSSGKHKGKYIEQSFNDDNVPRHRQELSEASKIQACSLYYQLMFTYKHLIRRESSDSSATIASPAEAYAALALASNAYGESIALQGITDQSYHLRGIKNAILNGTFNPAGITGTPKREETTE